MMVIIWIICVCIGLDPITAFFVSFLGAGVLGMMEDDEPKQVNNYYMIEGDNNESQ